MVSIDSNVTTFNKNVQLQTGALVARGEHFKCLWLIS